MWRRYRKKTNKSKKTNEQIDVWTGLYPDENRIGEVAKVLKLPQAIIPLCTVVIGHPAEQPQPKDKWKPENVSYNEYGGKAE